MEPTASIDHWLPLLLGPYGLVVGLIGFAWAMYKEWLVPGATHRRMREERDAALRRLDRSMHVAGRAVDAATPPSRPPP